MRAIDLYSGVGGWSLGLQLAGIDVVTSYEFWGPANETNFKNNKHATQTINIRNLTFDELPREIDLVVGSPPCTQFSFANRGGNGDLEDGLLDIERFLEIVEFLEPKFWIMENVPRVAKILEQELLDGGKLSRFRKLGCEIKVYDISEFGLPQRRKRCFAGNINFSLLEKYAISSSQIDLGTVLKSLSSSVVKDPIYGIKLSHDELIDHTIEDFLSDEEVRINQANKVNHTVYNKMPFPDPTDTTVRTITATCTRVSRESVVVSDSSEGKKYRRLTLRERASLQGFPITYQFYGNSYSQKLKMIGNAVPPVFSYLVGNAILNTAPQNLKSLKALGKNISQPRPVPRETPPEKNTKNYPANRSFRFAIPQLRLKSGVRFELSNKNASNAEPWALHFYYGSSKNILSIELNSSLYNHILSKIDQSLKILLSDIILEFDQICKKCDLSNLQRVWEHKGPGGTRPFDLLDIIDYHAKQVIDTIVSSDLDLSELVSEIVCQRSQNHSNPRFGVTKLEKNNHIVIAGFLIGARFNEHLKVKSAENKKVELLA